MRRAIVLLVLLTLAAAAAWWLSGQNHEVELSAGTWSARAPAPVAGALVLGAVLLIAFLALLLRAVVAMPQRMSRWSSRNRRAAGDRAIEEALAALAAGNVNEARRATTLARAKLGDRALTLWLDSRAAIAAGDDAAADAALKKLARVPRGAVPGLRGLASRAAQGGDTAQARRLLADATRTVRAPALAEAQIELALRARDWSGALNLARGLSMAGRRRAEIALAAARALPEGDERVALLREAAGADATFAPATAEYAAALLARGEMRRFRRMLREAWQAGPHPALAAVALQRQPGEDARAVAARVADLASSAPGASSHLLRAQAELNASQWHEARRQISAAREAGANTRAVHLLLADLAEAEPATDDAARAKARDAVREHLREAAMAPPDAAWRCRVCGTVHETWVPVCDACGTALSLDWVTGAGALTSASKTPALAIAAPEA
jgi:HemY protein